MAKIYYIACKSCNLFMCLDKLRPEVVNTRQQAISAGRNISMFRAGLLLSFMAQHQGHDCTLTNDCDDIDLSHMSECGQHFWTTQTEAS